MPNRVRSELPSAGNRVLFPSYLEEKHIAYRPNEVTASSRLGGVYNSLPPFVSLGITLYTAPSLSLNSVWP